MGAGMVSVTNERSAQEHGRSRWKIELVVSDQPGKSASELATRLGLALLIWGSKMPGYAGDEFLRAIVGDAEKLKMVLGLVGCIGESDPLGDVPGSGRMRRITVGPVDTPIARTSPGRRGLMILNEGPGRVFVSSPVWPSTHYLVIDPGCTLDIDPLRAEAALEARADIHEARADMRAEVIVTEFLP